MRIFIFNPESDYALADFTPHYNLPRAVKDLRRNGAFTQLPLARKGDAILTLDEPDVALSLRAHSRGVEVLSPESLAEAVDKALRRGEDVSFHPWGWNPAIKTTLFNALTGRSRHAGNVQNPSTSRNVRDIVRIPEEIAQRLLPPDIYLELLRELSSRRLTSTFNLFLNDELQRRGLPENLMSPIPDYFDSADDAMLWLSENSPAFFKAPWSSSGRGILFTRDVSEEKCREWISGCIRRQGFVMAETAFTPKTLDFATEWNCIENQEPEFLGFSVFEASERGKYHSNLNISQQEMLNLIKRHLPDFDMRVIDAQKAAIRRTLYGYSGHLGIDMMAAEGGRMRGGVELNLRTTMGIIALHNSPKEHEAQEDEISKARLPRIAVIGYGNVGSHLYRALRLAGSDVCSVAARALPDNPDTLPADCDLYLIAVKDSEIENVAAKVSEIVMNSPCFSPGSNRPGRPVIAHTSGSVSVETLRQRIDPQFGAGVMYPMQTFSRDAEMDYASIPFLIEADSAEALSLIRDVASSISGNVSEADSRQRGIYHIAAVIACNFSNYLYTLADEYLQANNLDFKNLIPLITQTARKIRTTPPSQAQTGPAARKDLKVIEMQEQKLSPYPHLQEIYKLLSDSILNHGQNS